MTFQPQAGDTFTIDSIVHQLAEHPAARGVPYGQEGRAAVVYQLLTAEGQAHALKVFRQRFRVPALVGLADRLVAYAEIPGLQVCRRTVLTPQRHTALLRSISDLTYAVLMPWVSGPTWMEIIGGKQALTPQQSLSLAQGMANLLSLMEQRNLAHCDISGPNVILPGLLASSTGDAPSLTRAPHSPVALVDVEQMFGPALDRPEALPSGSPGYAHRTAPSGLWSAQADRFAGAVLLAEMLGWCHERVREAASEESYFTPDEIQKDNERYALLKQVLRERWGDGVATLLERAWESETLAHCATFGEWLIALPEGPRPVHVTQETTRSETTPSDAPPDAHAAARAMLALAREFEAQDNRESALEAYRQALAVAPARSGLAHEITVMIRDLEAQAPTIKSHDAMAPLFEDGLAAYRRGDWKRAKELLGAVVGAEPDYAREGQVAARLLADARQRDHSRSVFSLWRWVLVGAAVLTVLCVLAIGSILLYQGFGSRAIAGGADTTATTVALPNTDILPTTSATITPLMLMAEPTPVPTTAPSDEPTAVLGVGSTTTSPSDGMVSVYVPAGEFLIGDNASKWADERPQHTVHLDAFWIDQTEVTNRMFQRFVQASSYETEAERAGVGYFWNGAGWDAVVGASWRTPFGQESNIDNRLDQPVIHMSWNDAVAYCTWAGRRLPTEAEWEKAARGTDGRLYPWGNAPPDARHGNFGGNVGDLIAVGSYPQNASPYGALDMAGNVYEWVADWYGKDYYSNSPSQNPAGPTSGTYRVVRGGSWQLDPLRLRTVEREVSGPQYSNSNIGFRCALAVGAP